MGTTYGDTPLATDGFSRMQLEAFSETPRVGTLFTRFFSNPRYFFQNNLVDIQIQRAHKKMAPMVVRGVDVENQNKVQDSGWTEISRTFPLIEESLPLSADQLTKRVFTEAIYNGLTKQQRARRLATEKLTQIEIGVVDTCEYLASQSFTNASQPGLLTETYGGYEYDFLRHSDGKKTYLADWATVGTDANADIDAACDFVITKGKGRPRVMLIGSTKFLEWTKTTQFLAIADKRHKINIQADYDQPAPSYLKFMENAGADFQFNYKTAMGRKLAVFTYDHTYINRSGSEVRLLGANDMIIFDPFARFDVAWGPNDYMDHDTAKMQMYMDVFGMNLEAMGRASAAVPSGFLYGGFHYDAYWSSLSGKGIDVRVQAAPLYVTTQTDAICTTKESW